MKDFLKKYHVHIGIIISIAGILTALSVPGFTKKDDPSPVKVSAPEISTGAMLDAMVRAWSGSKRFLRVCYDGPSQNGKYGFFIEYGPKTDPEDRTLAEGWWFIEQQFFTTSAGKIYTNDILSVNNDLHVYPDVTGLACKDKQ